MLDARVVQLSPGAVQRRNIMGWLTVVPANQSADVIVSVAIRELFGRAVMDVLV